MGTFYLTMDAKGRMSFPSKLREVIGDRFIVTKGLDGCLYVYSCTEFREMTRRLKTKPMAEARLFSRSFVGYATVAETDKNGRILIPQALRECAGLSKDVVVVGVIDRCEIWSKEKWELYNSDNEDRLAATLEGLQL
ncbi:MAG: division/cell wall cluster transcriptional repressor MraZ [Ruminococcus sp.]|nr:division/cell wall cluster transcriptional repressor MraZ [Ruminococcus sp.]